MTELTDRQKYYDGYDPDEGGRWWVKEVPVAEPWFQEELNRFAGFSDRGQPKLRLSWGGTLMSDITEKPSLKHKRVVRARHGFNYNKNDGTVGWARSMKDVTDADEPLVYSPHTEVHEVGYPRWAIEIHVPAHELRRLGRFVNLRAPDGEKILRDLPEEGVYDHFFWIQTRDNRYRDPDREVLTAVEAMYVYNISTSEAQKALDDIERAKQNRLIGAQEARAIWQGIG